MITEVNEGDGTVDLVRVRKIGETEMPITVDLSGSMFTQ